MSWGFKFHGVKSDVEAAVRNFQCSYDANQVEAVRRLILDEIAGFDDSYGIEVVANGSTTLASPGFKANRSLVLNISLDPAVAPRVELKPGVSSGG